MKSSKAVATFIKHDAIMQRCSDKTLLQQISKQEISQLIRYIMGEEPQNRLAKLPIGTCTRFDKRTLGAKDRPESDFQPTRDQLLAYKAYYAQKPLLPRTIIAMRKTETVTHVYILLGCKLSDAYAGFPGAESKNRQLKQSGAFKHKTNVLFISISENINEIEVELKAITKMKKGITSYMDWLKVSRHAALIQHTLAQYCDGIMDCLALTLDDTFTDKNMYIVSELGHELLEIVHSNLLKDSADKMQIIKGICRALCFLHRFRIVHLDIKPENIIIESQKRPKLIDFDFIAESGKSTALRGTKEYMPIYFLGAPNFIERPVSTYFKSTLRLNDEEKLQLYKSCYYGGIISDIWAFGVLLFEVYNQYNIDTPKAREALNSYQYSSNAVEKAMFQILCPASKDCYLLATDEQLRQDASKPLSERTFLSLEKLHLLLFGHEYIVDEAVVKELQPQMQELFAMRPKASF